MFNRRFATLFVGCALVAACGKEEAAPAANNQAEAIVVRSAHQKELFDLTPLNRAVALKRAIQDQGLMCKQVVKTGYVGRYKNMDVWTAGCADKRDWALFISADDSVQVRNCKDLTQLGLPECTIQPGTEGGTGLGQDDQNQGSDNRT
nr:hypothetical protein [uncultured Sphingomonas sp.]